MALHMEHEAVQDEGCAALAQFLGTRETREIIISQAYG